MKMIKYASLLTALLCSSVVNAAIISDYDKSVAAANGWKVVYQGGYGATFNYDAVLAAITAGSKVALASSSSNGASTFDLFAGTSLSTLQTITDYNTTVLADEAYWYRNSYSVGFAPSAIISQNTADTHNMSGGDGVDGDKRLSWHGGSNVFGGWRSGLNVNLNGDNVWQRYVLVQESQSSNDVPEPASIALLGLGLAGFASARRRRKTAKSV